MLGKTMRGKCLMRKMSLFRILSRRYEIDGNVYTAWVSTEDFGDYSKWKTTIEFTSKGKKG